MAQWFSFVAGQQYGPVDDNGLRDWIRQGRVGPGDLIWSAGMPKWAPAATVMPDMFPPGAASAAAGGAYQAYMPGLTTVLPAGGTGGQTPNGQLAEQALASLNGRWGMAIGFCVLAVLLQMAAGVLPYVGGLIQILLTGPLVLGQVAFFLTYVRGGQGDLGMLFAGFKNFAGSLAAYLLMVLFVYGWMLLFSSIGIVLLIVTFVMAASEGGDPNIPLLVAGCVLLLPGFVAATVAQLAYSQTFFFLADNRQLGPLEAIRVSRQAMNGNKAKLFLLQLRFIGWVLLCLLTCGIGFIWLIPYMNLAFARFHDDILPPAAAAAAATPAQAQPTQA